MIVLGCMYIGYAALYMCRKTVVISGPAMLDDPMLGLTKTAWGAILGWGTAGTVVGKLINGVLADRLGGRRVFILSLSLCMLATTVFGTMSGVLFFSIAYFVALFGKSTGLQWPTSFVFGIRRIGGVEYGVSFLLAQGLVQWPRHWD